MPHAPTAEQTVIITAATANPSTDIVVRARAGTGKTTTIADHLLPKLTGNALVLAFNKSIEKELRLRVPAELQFTVSISTVHAFGLAAFRRAHSKFKVESGKLHFILKNLTDTNSSVRDMFNSRGAGKSAVVRLVSYAKSNGVGIEAADFHPIEDVEYWHQLIEHFNMEIEFEDAGISLSAAISLAQKILTISNKTLTAIDFDDMVYLPLLLNLPIPRFNHVVIDEAQDISRTRMELAMRAAVGGRIIAVGDEKQAIYGFTGANASAMSDIIHRTRPETTPPTIVLPLTVCWRCDDLILAEARKLVPDIQTRPNAPSGTVSTLPISDFLSPENHPPLGSAILCRLNKPNVAMALELLRNEIPVKIEGRDLGRTILAHAKSACPNYMAESLWDIQPMLQDYHDSRVAALIAKNKSAQAAYLSDELQAAMLLLDRALETSTSPAPSWMEFEHLVQTLFADDIKSSQLVTLSSVHKAKGREWKNVYILGQSDYMPFVKAISEWEIEQEFNLIYVATTRAEQSLTRVTGVKEWLDDRKE